ncbi:DUF4157 domain-containing protein [Mucilaginibacter sp. BJC16-A38]|uniref:DUF4157 domain-containing protein n=1 Tax=Mucilaginibacter phenanthrenivorans TaxID=1234842 RepID=UPI002158827D|nr:DUF4157 domain-containing protein [Mucilaginibacter phenanthrenivorans]MCR8557639.1 DUF4157 domain-containing protein [Mucilaginibacter phenanthrenivorans]
MNLAPQTASSNKQKQNPPVSAAFFQPKLTVNQPGDVYEQEADHMADKVMRMTDLSAKQNYFFRPVNNAAQRKCQACEEEEEKHVHRKEKDGGEVHGGQYSPEGDSEKKLIAHELTHVIQQNGSSGSIQRLCTPAPICRGGGIAGSAEAFDIQEEKNEEAARTRRLAQSPSVAVSNGHGGRATQLEIFLEAQFPGRLATIQGIFIDMDMSPKTGAFTEDCSQWIADSLPSGTVVPGMAGATRHCVFVHGFLNQQALQFNTTSAATIGRFNREDWRVNTLQTLTHESQHGIFDTAPHSRPAGIRTPACTRAHLQPELTELSAEISEFPAAFRAIPAAAPATDPARQRLANWFNTTITDPREGIRGILQTMGCSCNCREVDAFVTDTYNFTTTSWTTAEKAAFNAEMNNPVWGIRWPIP